MADTELEAEFRALEEAFKLGAQADETPEETGRAVLDVILKLVRARYRIADDDPRRGAIEDLAIRRMIDPVGLGPRHSVVEAALRRLAKDPANAVQYLTRHIEARSAAQSTRARKPRPRDALTQLIDEMVKAFPRISEKQVMARFTKSEGVVILEDEIRHIETATTMQVSNLRGRVSEAKARLKKKSG